MPGGELGSLPCLGSRAASHSQLVLAIPSPWCTSASPAGIWSSKLPATEVFTGKMRVFCYPPYEKVVPQLMVQSK